MHETWNLQRLADEIINGRRLTREDDLQQFITCDLEELCSGADRIRRALCGDKVDLCTIINGKAGRCSEDCKFCAQSARNTAECETYSFLDPETILAHHHPAFVEGRGEGTDCRNGEERREDDALRASLGDIIRFWHGVPEEGCDNADEDWHSRHLVVVVREGAQDMDDEDAGEDGE